MPGQPQLSLQTCARGSLHGVPAPAITWLQPGERPEGPPPGEPSHLPDDLEIKNEMSAFVVSHGAWGDVLHSNRQPDH